MSAASIVPTSPVDSAAPASSPTDAAALRRENESLRQSLAKIERERDEAVHALHVALASQISYEEVKEWAKTCRETCTIPFDESVKQIEEMDRAFRS